VRDDLINQLYEVGLQNRLMTDPALKFSMDLLSAYLDATEMAMRDTSIDPFKIRAVLDRLIAGAVSPDVLIQERLAMAHAMDNAAAERLRSQFVMRVPGEFDPRIRNQPGEQS